MFKPQETIMPELNQLLELCNKVLDNLADHSTYFEISNICNTLKFKRFIRIEHAAKSQWFDFLQEYCQNQTCPKTLLLLGYFYQHGLIVTQDNYKRFIFIQDYQAATAHYKKAINLGCPEAMVNYAQLLLLGLGCEKDRARAIELLDRAVQLGNPQAMVEKGRFYQQSPDQNNRANGIKLFNSAANLGSISAIVGLAHSFKNGLGCEKNLEKARELYNQANTFGNSPAKVGLAEIYCFGQGVEKDCAKALELLEQAIALGNPQAMYHAAFIHSMNSNGGQQGNKAKEIALFEQALRLGIIYAKEKLRPINFDKALAKDLLALIWPELEMGYSFSADTLNALKTHVQSEIIEKIMTSPLATSLYFLKDLNDNKKHPLRQILGSARDKLPSISLLFIIRSILLAEDSLNESCKLPIELRLIILSFLQPGYEMDKQQAYVYSPRVKKNDEISISLFPSVGHKRKRQDDNNRISPT